MNAIQKNLYRYYCLSMTLYDTGSVCLYDVLQGRQGSTCAGAVTRASSSASGRRPLIVTRNIEYFLGVLARALP